MRNLEPKNYSQRWYLFNKSKVKSNDFQRFKSERSKWFKDDPNKFLDPRKGEVVSRSWNARKNMEFVLKHSQ